MKRFVAAACAALPDLRGIAALLVACACLIQWTGRLPTVTLLAGLAGGAVVVAVAGWSLSRWQAGRRSGMGRLVAGRLPASVWLALAAHGCIAAALGGWLLLQIQRGLEARLLPALEGATLELVGVVDEMAQRFDFGDRVRFAVEQCRIIEPAAVAAGAAPAAAGCGRLARVQLDWGAPRERDRVAGRAAAEDGEDGADAGADAIWPEPGERWRLVVRLRRPVASVNPGGFDLELRLLQQGIGALGRVAARERLAAAPSWRDARRIVEVQRSRLRDRLEALYARRIDTPDTGRAARWPLIGIVAGLAIGDQAAISAVQWGLFSRTGVSHLMAISGMHVTMLALLAAALLSRLLRILARRAPAALLPWLSQVPRRTVVLCAAVLVAFGYALLSGWGIPAQRTCWMLATAAALALGGRSAGRWTPVLVAAGVVVAADPWAVAAAGFWLSFGAIAAILWCATAAEVEARPRPGRWRAAAVDAVRSQWAATVGLAPLVIALFSTLSLVGPLANAAAIPWIGFLIAPLAVATTLIAPFAENLAAGLLAVTLWLLAPMLALLGWLDALPAASTVVARPGPWTLAAAVVGAAVVIAPIGSGSRMLGGLCLVPLLAGVPRLPPADELWITALDIGQGSGVLVEAGDARLLFDTGGGRGDDRGAAQRVLLPHLQARGIDRIDTLIVSHLDVEHAGGAATVLSRLRPQRLVTGFDQRLLSLPAAATAGVAAFDCAAPARFSVGPLQVTVLHPSRIAATRAAARDNRNSCVVRVASAAGAVLLAGDLPARSEPALIAAAVVGALRADVLVVPQQGGRDGAGERLLAAVSPAHALLQVGYRNRHRHPHPRLLERLAAHSVAVWRTDRDGAVRVRLRAGRAPEVTRTRVDAPPYWRLQTPQ
ncbi:MAG: DNA internalization-related competence protein ComEC/Rec2 [Lautropia sp.]